MTTTLARTAAPVPLLTLGGIITSMVQHAAREGRQLRPGGYFGQIAAMGLRAGGKPNEAALQVALSTELQLRYGAEIGQVDIFGATHSAIAVVFDAHPMAAAVAGDPVDIVTPWEVDLPLAPLQEIVTAMLGLTPRNEHGARVLVERLRDYAAGLAAWRHWPDSDTQTLIAQVAAGNMSLLFEHIRRAREETARDWVGAIW